MISKYQGTERLSKGKRLFSMTKKRVKAIGNLS